MTQFDRGNRKIRATDCKLGQIKRIINSITIDKTDEIVYAGSNSGDLLQISLKHTLFQYRGPPNKPFAMGIQTVIETKDGNIIIGAGDGTVALLQKGNLKILKSIKLDGMITSLVLNKSGDHFFVGTSKSMMYLVSLSDFDYEQRGSAHFDKINDVIFPKNNSSLFITAGVNDVRIWHSNKKNELFRICVPNLECNCVRLSNDGSMIVTGWNDGKVRAFYPESGRLMFTIHNCHKGSVTALDISNDNKKLVTGGTDSNVRIWQINKDEQIMLVSLKEHQSMISYITINEDNTEFVSASNDGSCVVWELNQPFSRVQAMFGSTQFSTVIYHPDQSQFITTGTDHQITYWDATDGSPIRIVDGSESAITSLSINKQGTHFVSAGHDRLIKLWHYDDGIFKHIGTGHSGTINRCAFAPDNSKIVSVGQEGAIMIWKVPKNI